MVVTDSDAALVLVAAQFATPSSGTSNKPWIFGGPGSVGKVNVAGSFAEQEKQDKITRESFLVSKDRLQPS